MTPAKPLSQAHKYCLMPQSVWKYHLTRSILRTSHLVFLHSSRKRLKPPHIAFLAITTYCTHHISTKPINCLASTLQLTPSLVYSIPYLHYPAPSKPYIHPSLNINYKRKIVHQALFKRCWELMYSRSELICVLFNLQELHNYPHHVQYIFN